MLDIAGGCKVGIVSLICFWCNVCKSSKSKEEKYKSKQFLIKKKY